MDDLEEGYVKIKFMGPALEFFREEFPDWPPADELIIKAKMGQCHYCGKDMRESEIGGIDPTEITEDGELLGEFVCSDCMEEGR